MDTKNNSSSEYVHLAALYVYKYCFLTISSVRSSEEHSSSKALANSTPFQYISKRCAFLLTTRANAD